MCSCSRDITHDLYTADVIIVDSDAVSKSVYFDHMQINIL